MGYWGVMALVRRRIVVGRPPCEIAGTKAVRLGIVYLVYSGIMLVGGGTALFGTVARWAGWKL